MSAINFSGLPRAQAEALARQMEQMREMVAGVKPGSVSVYGKEQHDEVSEARDEIR